MSPDNFKIISLTEKNIDNEHICCGFSDKKIAKGIRLKKELIKRRLFEGFQFKKVNVRGKVFIEYVPTENAWSPIEAPGYTFIHCFWVSGRYKGQGLGSRLIDECIKDSEEKNGIVCVTTKKGTVTNKKGLTFIYSDLCPFTDHWVDKMISYAQDLNIPSQKTKITTLVQAQNAPSAFSIFTIFYNGEFLTHKIPSQKEFIKILNAKRN